MSKLLVVLESKKFYSPERFLEEGKKLGFETSIWAYPEIIVKIDDNLTTFESNSQSINDFDCFIFRGFAQFNNLKDAMVKYLIKQGKSKRILNEESYKTTIGQYHKLQQYISLSENHIPLVETVLFPNKNEILSFFSSKDLNSDKYILKPIDGTHGQGVKLVSKEVLDSIDEENANNLIFQKYVENKFQIRVVFLGDKIIGGMSQTRVDEDKVILNGGVTASAEVDEELKEIVLKAAKLLNLEFGGVDAIYDEVEKRYRILEVNRMPGVKEFEKSTGINLVGEIVKYTCS